MLLRRGGEESEGDCKTGEDVEEAGVVLGAYCCHDSGRGDGEADILMRCARLLPAGLVFRPGGEGQ